MQGSFTRFIILLAVACTMALEAAAQDPRFSQFYATPNQINPALNGVFDGTFRFTANYRELYSSILSKDAFRTFAAGVEFRNKVGRSGDYYGLSLSALRDDVGISNFNRFHAHVGGSYLKQLSGSRYRNSDQYLIAGAQIGAGQRGFDWGRLWFSNQFNSSQAFVDYGSASGEDFQRRETNIFLDFNAGLLWYAIFDKNASVYAGGALHHINEPNISFVETRDEVLHRKWVGHAGGEIPFSDQLSLLPAVAVMGQHKGMSAALGANVRYTNRDWKEIAVRAGAWAHVVNRLDQGMHLDAIAVTTVLEMERWNLGLSYDVTTSILSAANNSRGAFEMSFIYVQPSQQRFKVSCPRF
ncbi:MAG TPA: PorP/SprF family type IX secretion system membrane protein [Saprospiraceae bacterium]|nr:PorP/SprF family type IX secretion system membrane protein [Saprospiraceae bacterium]HRK82372.1 PorP/SprF family type IX secretion system membrane protein [Saprospiraceae bacterium]